MDSGNVFMHRCENQLFVLKRKEIIKRMSENFFLFLFLTYMSLLIHRVVGEFDFLERDFVFHPLGACCRTVGMSVDSGRPLGLGFTRSEPSGVETETRIVGQHQIHKDKIFDIGVQTAQIHFESREHAPMRSNVCVNFH